MRDGQKLTASYSNLPSHGRHKGKALFNYTMKQIPILFSQPMVEAILAGRKTQTRRILKGIAIEWLDSGFTPEFVANPENGLCRYGYTGDQLWVKETYYAYGRWEYRTTQKKGKDHDGWHFVDRTDRTDFGYRYLSNPPKVVMSGRGGMGWYKRPSLFMPRDASRILPEVENNRIERLQDISEADAIAEGVESWVETRLRSQKTHYKVYYEENPDDPSFYCTNAIDSFSSLWKSINGPESWSKTHTLR